MGWRSSVCNEATKGCTIGNRSVCIPGYLVAPSLEPISDATRLFCLITAADENYCVATSRTSRRDSDVERDAGIAQGNDLFDVLEGNDRDVDGGSADHQCRDWRA